MRPVSALLSAALLCLPTAARSQLNPDICRSLGGDDTRLWCYDKVFPRGETPPAPVKEPAKPKTPKQRDIFAQSLKLRGLQSGMSWKVWAEGKNNEKLIVWYALLSSASIYRLIVDGPLLQEAKDAGFTEIEFDNHDKRWRFDPRKTPDLSQF